MKVFLDFGGNKAQGLKKFIDMYQIDDSWVIETFEPDPNCSISEHTPNLKNLKINNAAIWTHTGKVKFSQMLENTEGSSVECLMSEGNCSTIGDPSYRYHNSIIDVDCFDISEVLNKYKDADFVLVKMDIEGSEFKVLRKAISDNTLSIIDVLFIEWHTGHVKGESFESCEILKSTIINSGIQLQNWY